MKTIAFIPARGGSKSIPLKNLKLFCGKPLIYWVLNAANQVKDIDEIVVATDSSEIEDAVSKFYFDKVNIYHRDVLNAQDHSSTESVMMEYIEKSNLQNEDCFILIQATSPLLTEKHLNEGLSRFNLDKYDSVLSCVETKRFFWNKDGSPLNYDYANRPRRQDFSGMLMENGAFYINSIANIKKYKNRLSGNIAISLMEEYTAVEIDEPEDWVIAEELMKRFGKRQEKVNKIKLVLSDVDGVLTDAGMYYSETGDEFKKFNTRDGMGFQILREKGFKTGIITSENTKIVERRAKKLKVDYVYQSKKHGGKLEAAIEICKKENIELDEVAYIGDDVNCFELLSKVGVSACPNDAVKKIKKIKKINILETKGGQGAFREFSEFLIKE
ncbi:cytidylyltransferase domain-containing protein [Algibacter sp. R77976]|uniref:cytidylyltransferase domain-containing protein n=1 Tax=Algibacter sp. R77976 TaxID=3093873 RepID=UPI0037CA2D5D